MGLAALLPPLRSAPVAVAVAGLLLTTWLVRRIAAWSRMRHVPGPFLNSITVWPLLRRSVRGDLHLYMKDLSDRYGPIVQIAPGEVMFTDPEAFRRVGSARGGYQKDEWYDCSRFTPGQEHLLCMRDDETRRERKAKLAAGYSGREKKSFERGIDKQVTALLALIERSYVSDDEHHRPIDFARTAQFFTLDAIGELAFSAPFGFLANDRDMHGFIEITSSFFPVFGVLSTLPWLARLMHRWPLSKLVPNENDQIGFGRMMGFSAGFVNKRLEPGAERRHDIMQAFIDSGLERDELMQEVILQIIAGSDTTASALRFTLLHLISTPHAYARLQAELDAAAASGQLPPAASGTIVSSDAARALPYLQAVVREGLRLWPPGNGLVYKLVPPGGDTLAGVALPAGTPAGQNMYGIARLPSLWGPDAESFVPERWLRAPPARAAEMQAVLDLVFGHGKFACLGRTIALMELDKVFVELLRRYDVAVVAPIKPMEILSASVWVTKNFWLRITRRPEPPK